MRILTVVNWLGIGGIEKGLLQSIPFLNDQGIQVDVCCLGARNVLDQDFENHGCKIWRIPKSANCFTSAKALEAVLRQRTYSLVHSQFGYTSGGFALGAARQGVPCAVSIHSCEPLSLYAWRNKPLLSTVRKGWLAWHRRLMNKHVDTFIGHSCTNIQRFKPDWQSDQSHYRVILNGVNFPAETSRDKQEARQALGIPLEQPVLLHVGSFRREKNHTGLLQIFARVLKELPEALLLLVGEGDLQEETIKEAQTMGILDRIRFEGTQKNVWPYYHAADLFVFPSTTEGFGNALVESAVARLPLVASDIPAHQESVPPPQQRFLFPLPDYDRAADFVMQQFQSAQEERNPWIDTSETYARKNFAIERYAKELGDTYEEIVQNAA